MRTRAQKADDIAKLKELLKKSGSLAFADFTGVDTASIAKLKGMLKVSGARYRVTKKRLFQLVLKDAGVAFDPKQHFKGQLGTVFAPGDALTVASMLYKFAKDLAREKKHFTLLGGYDMAGRKFMSAEEFMVLAKLPSREILLAQVMGMFTISLRQFMFLLGELSKRTPVAASAVGGGTQTVEPS